MLHAKFQDHMTYSSGEEYFKGVYHIWELRPSWSCDRDHFYKFMSPLPNELNIKFWL